MKYTMLHPGELSFLRVCVANALDGVIVAAGTYKGGDVMAMMQAHPQREYHVIDSFAGLAPPVEQDKCDGMPGAGEFSCGGHDAYLANFEEAGLPTPITYPMFITPEALTTVPAMPVAFLWLDLDHYAPTKACLDYFWPMLAYGSVVACHDYGFHLTPGVKRACDSVSTMWMHASGGIFYARKI